MILKVVDTGYMHTGRVWFFDKLKNVTKESRPVLTAEEYRNRMEQDKWEFTIDTQGWGPVKEQEEEKPFKKTFQVISARHTETDEPLLFLFDTDAYLLNDSGDTIEKIKARNNKPTKR